MSEPEIGTQEAIAIGARLSGRKMLAARPARPGGNNRVFCLENAEGLRFALKYYPSQAIDGRDRLGQEYEALSFLSRHGLTSTPRPIARDAAESCALYQWFDGEAAALSSHPGDADQLADFLIDLQRLRDADDAADLRRASAGVFSPLEVVAQYEQRLGRLRRSAGKYPDLRAFLDGGLVPTGAMAIRRLRQRYARLGQDPGAPLALAQRALSPSDFGLHNALRGDDGRLRFIDFEYFGWDDPVKLVSDTAIHPGSSFPDSAARRLIERLSQAFEARDPMFAVRRDVLYPVFGLIWCLIILNDYLPERRSMRILATQDSDLEARLAGQFDKARRLHQTICERDPDLAPR
jgi:phosphotransferase family enzyme